jgi:hypothetical protein
MRSIDKNNKLYTRCPYFLNITCDCEEGICKTRDVFKKQHQEEVHPSEIETPLKKFFDYMKKNNYWIGNDLVEEYRRLRQEETSQKNICHYSGLRTVESYEKPE